jgi:hypothetical protein
LKKLEDTKVFKLRVPAALLRDLEEYASRDRRTVANLLRKIAEDFIAAERAKERAIV